MHEVDFSYLGQCLKDARKRCGLTQQELADQSGVGLRHIQNIENGTVNPSYECLAYLIKRLGISANLLFYPESSSQDTELGASLVNTFPVTMSSEKFSFTQQNSWQKNLLSHMTFTRFISKRFITNRIVKLQLL